MDLMEAIRARHSVRSYLDRPIEGEALRLLQDAIDACNRESGLHIQLCLGVEGAFAGRFAGANNHLALVGPKGAALEETCGYYGERLVLLAQQLGLNTCWVAASFHRGRSVAEVRPGEKLLMVIAIGYGETQGVPRKSKPLGALCRTDTEPPPEWFVRGVEAAMLAPTAINQQKFRFELTGRTAKATTGFGPYAKTDLGIAKYHFEVGAGDGGHWEWMARD